VVEAASTDQPSGHTGDASTRKEQAAEKSTAAPDQDTRTRTKAEARTKTESKAGAGTGTKADAGSQGEPGAAPEPPAPAPEPPAPEAPGQTSPAAEARAGQLASRLEEANSRHLRLAADFENYKKRVRQEQLDTMKYAAATVAERLLPVLDDADRARSHAPEGIEEGWLKGVRLTFQKLEEVLASVGVERIEALGAQFDPKQHEAVGSEETAKHPEDTVVAELRAGYRMHDRVLRPALVKVARPPA